MDIRALWASEGTAIYNVFRVSHCARFPQCVCVCVALVEWDNYYTAAAQLKKDLSQRRLASPIE